MARSSFLRTPPVWREALSAPREIKDWLLERGSLTKRLIEIFGPVRVVLLKQGFDQLFPEERHWIGHRRGWVREVVLWCGNRPQLAARTIGSARLASRFSDQGEKPLGERLFTDPEIDRLTMNWCRVRPFQWRAADLPHPSWGRRGLYAVQGQPMLVAEFFLWL